MAHAHTHGMDLRRADSRRRMRLALVINIAMFAAALVGGVITGSLAVLADAGHVLSDVGSIALGLFAASLATRPASARRTFGLHRTEVLAALANGIALVVIAVLVAVAAMDRLGDPVEIDGAGVLALGLLGLAGNLLASWVLVRGDRRDLNLEGVLRHSVADALGSLAVVASGAIILATGWHEADPIAALAVAALILMSSARLILEPLEVLLEAAPAGMDVEELAADICATGGVRAVHELHVWTLTPGFIALSAHVVVGPGTDRDRARRELEYLLRERHSIEHTTLQMEGSGEEGELLQLGRKGPS